MLEVILVMSIVFACLYMPLRGKTLQQLSPKQHERVLKSFKTYRTTKKGKLTPDMSVEEYLPILQKQGLTYLIVAIVGLPIYIAVFVFLYSGIF